MKVETGPSIKTVQVLRRAPEPVDDEQSSRFDLVLSLWIFILIVLSTIANLFYLIGNGNLVTLFHPEVKDTRQDWLLASNWSGTLNDQLVYDFLRGEHEEESDDPLEKAFQVTPAESLSNESRCFRFSGHASKDPFGFCDRLDPLALPSWCTHFEALAIQMANFSTAEQFTSSARFTALTVFEAFLGNQWDRERLVCTTAQLATVGAVSNRTLYTKSLGLLRSVDCSDSLNRVTLACRLVNNQVSVPVFTTPSGLASINTYEVFRSTEGTELILHPQTSDGRLGPMVKRSSFALADYCTYKRGQAVLKMTAEYTQHHVSIPYMALVAKVELIGVVSVIWIMKYQCKLARVQDALIQCSRLGIYVFMLAQIMFSAYFEQDIIRVMFALDATSVMHYILWLYTMSTVILVVTLLSLLVLRGVFVSSIYFVGGRLSILLSLSASLVEYGIATAHYRYHTRENGLELQDQGCERPSELCRKEKFNYLLLVNLVALIPMLVELYLHRVVITHRHRHIDHVNTVSENQVCPSGPSRNHVVLTSFENHCLDGLPACNLITDLPAPHIWVKGHPCSSATVITACGFTVIRRRFLVRTKDLALILLAEACPAALLRDLSTIVWPLSVNNGYICVQHARRVFLKRIHRFHITKTGLASEQDHALS